MNAVRNHNRQFIRGIGIVDETSCGPLCQHPACWKSNERVEKGLPKLTDKPVSTYDDEDELPAVKVYNILEDYGFSSRDRFPSVTSKPCRPKSLHGSDSLQLATCPMNTPSPSRFHGVKSIEPKPEDKGTCIPVKQIEVQEVFDLEDLSNTWDNTFLSKQYYVWVPNPKWKKPKPTAENEEKTNPGPIPPRDLTEELVPQSIERDREASITKRNTQRRSWSPFRFFSPSFWQTTRDDVDIEGINELLDLPRDVLMKVLDHCHPSDLKSRERLHEIIHRFMPHYEYINADMDHSQDDILRQTKIPLHEAKFRNQRQPALIASGEPVFRFDENINRCICSANAGLTPMNISMTPMSVGLTPMNSSAEITRSHSPRTKLLSKYKKPLPGIGERGSSLDNIKVASVSLGLPELPSGVRTTRAFNYTNLNMDFTLGPSIPMTSRSVVLSEAGGSDHGTTVNVNIPSQFSEKLEVQTLPDRIPESQHSTHMTQESIIQTVHVPGLVDEQRYVCPDPPLGTPMSAPGLARSYTKSSGIRREKTMNSVTETSQEKPRSGRSQERRVHVSSPALLQRELSQTDTRRSPTSTTAVLGKISESAVSEPGDIRKVVPSRRSIVLQKEVPPQPPSSPQSGLVEMSSMSPVPSMTHVITTVQGVKELHVITPQATQGESQEQSDLLIQETPQTGNRTDSPASSTEAWPTDVVEKSFEMSRSLTQQSTYIPMTPETLDSTAVGFDTRSEKSHLTSVPPSEIGSQMSEEKSSAKQKLTEKTSRESPGPPPPSPEPKKPQALPLNSDRFSSKSRDSLSMAPVFEENESDEEVSISADPPNPLTDSQHFPDLILEPNNDQPQKNAAAFVASDKIEDTPEKGSNLSRERLELRMVSTELKQGQEAPTPDYSDRQETDSLKDLQMDESCPPETDGRSSTYLTDRDRRFTPEGMESPLHSTGRRSTHRSDTISPWQREIDFTADISEYQGQNTSTDEERNENKNNGSEEKELSHSLNKYNDENVNQNTALDNVLSNTEDRLLLQIDLINGNDDADGLVPVGPVQLEDGIFEDESEFEGIMDDDDDSDCELGLDLEEPDIVLEEPLGETSPSISMPESSAKEHVQVGDGTGLDESLLQNCQGQAILTSDISKGQVLLQSSTDAKDISPEPYERQSQAFLTSDDIESKNLKPEPSTDNINVVVGNDIERVGTEGHQPQNDSASMDEGDHSVPLEGTNKDSSDKFNQQTDEINTELGLEVQSKVNKDTDSIDKVSPSPTTDVEISNGEAETDLAEGDGPSYIN